VPTRFFIQASTGVADREQGINQQLGMLCRWRGLVPFCPPAKPDADAGKNNVPEKPTG